METTASAFDALYEKSENFSKTSYQLAKLKSLESSTIVITSLISMLSVIIMITLFFLVFNIGIALWLGDLLGKAYYGFFIIAMLYLFAGTILHFYLSGWIKKPVSNLIINQALQQN